MPDKLEAVNGLIIKQDIESKMADYRVSLSQKNDASIVLPRFTRWVVQSVHICVSNANQAESIDERIKILVDGLQKIVNRVENDSETLKNTVNELRIQINTMENVITRIDQLSQTKDIFSE